MSTKVPIRIEITTASGPYEYDVAVVIGEDRYERLALKRSGVTEVVGQALQAHTSILNLVGSPDA